MAISFTTSVAIVIVVVVAIIIVVVGFIISLIQMISLKSETITLKSKNKKIQIELDALRNQGLEDELEIADELEENNIIPVLNLTVVQIIVTRTDSATGDVYCS